MNTNKKFERLEFIIPSYYSSAIVLRDFSGLDDEDENSIQSFLDKTVEQYGHAQFIYDYDTESYFSRRNDVDNLAGDVARIFLMIETK